MGSSGTYYEEKLHHNHSEEASIQVQQQLTSIRAEIATIKKLYSSFQKDILFEFETRTSLVAKKMKEEAMVYIESCKIKLQEDMDKWEESVGNRIEDHNLKKQLLADAFNQVDQRINNIANYQRDSTQMFEGSLENLKCTFEESLRQLQISQNDLESRWEPFIQKMSQCERSNQELRHFVSEVEQKLLDKMNNSSLVASEQLQDKWKQTKEDFNKLEREYSTKVYTLEQNIDVMCTELDRRVEALERTGRRQIVKDTDIIERISRLEAQMEERNKEQSNNRSVIEKVSKLEHHFTVINGVIETTISDISSIKRRQNDIDTSIHHSNKRDDVFRESYKIWQRNVELQLEDNQRQWVKVEELGTMQQTYLRKNLANETAIGTMRDQLSSLQKRLDIFKQELQCPPNYNNFDNVQKVSTKYDQELEELRQELHSQNRTLINLRQSHDEILAGIRDKQHNIEQMYMELRNSLSSLMTQNIRSPGVPMYSDSSLPSLSLANTINYDRTTLYRYNDKTDDTEEGTKREQLEIHETEEKEKEIEMETSIMSSCHDETFPRNSHNITKRELTDSLENISSTKKSIGFEKDEQYPCIDAPRNKHRDNETIQTGSNRSDTSQNQRKRVSFSDQLETLYEYGTEEDEIDEDVLVFDEIGSSDSDNEETERNNNVAMSIASFSSLKNYNLSDDENEDNSAVETDRRDLIQNIHQVSEINALERIEISRISVEEDSIRSWVTGDEDTVVKEMEAVKELVSEESRAIRSDSPIHNISVDPIGESSACGSRSSIKEELEPIECILEAACNDSWCDEQKKDVSGESSEIKEVYNANQHVPSKTADNIVIDVKDIHAVADEIEEIIDDETEPTVDITLSHTELDTEMEAPEYYPGNDDYNFERDNETDSNSKTMYMGERERAANANQKNDTWSDTKPPKRITPTLQLFSRPSAVSTSDSFTAFSSDTSDDDGDLAAKMFSDPSLRMKTLQTSSSSILSRMRTSPFSNDDDIDLEQLTGGPSEGNNMPTADCSEDNDGEFDYSDDDF